MPTWTTPKTDWKGTDYFLTADCQRIVDNLEYIADELGISYELTFYIGYKITTNNMNEITDLLEQIYAKLNSSWNRGYVKRRVDYGSAWNSKDLNIIESLIRDFKRQIDGELDNKATNYADEELICGDTISVGLI